MIRADFADVVAPRPDLAIWEAGRELLLYDPGNGRVHWLNQTASLIWSLLDGRSSVAQIAEEVSERFGRPMSDVGPAVHKIVEGLDVQGLLGNPKEPTAKPTEPPPQTEPSFIPVPASKCLERHNQLGWQAQSTYQVGMTYLGVRASDFTYELALANALVSHLIPGLVAPPNYSVRLPERRGLGLLYKTCQTLVRTTDPARLTWALLRHLDSYAQPKRSGLLLGLAAVIRGEEALLVPRSISNLEHLLARQLFRAGLKVLDTPWVDVDPSQEELTVNEPQLTFDPSPLEPWLDGWQQFAIKPGTYRIVGLVTETDRIPAQSHLYWIAQALRGARNVGEFEPEKAVENLLGLADRVAVRPVSPDSRELAATVARAW